MKQFTMFMLALLVFLGSACDGPTAGELSIDLVTPSSADGAILFKIRTPSPRELGEVTAVCSGCDAFTYRATASELFCAVTGPLQAGPLVRIAVSDVGMRSVYSVEILEIAGRDHRLRSDVGYELLLSH